MTNLYRIVLFVGPAGDGRALEVASAFAAVAGRLSMPVAPRAAALPEITPEDMYATRVVAVGRAVEAALRERFPDRAKVIEPWDPAAPVDELVNGLVARLLGGRDDAPDPPPRPAAKMPTVKVGRETAGRHGKGVVVIWDVPLDETGLKELAATLKDRCGTGGTVKDGRIEIQGDHRDRIVAELEKLGYKAKLAGG